MSIFDMIGNLLFGRPKEIPKDPLGRLDYLASKSPQLAPDIITAARALLGRLTAEQLVGLNLMILDDDILTFEWIIGQADKLLWLEFMSSTEIDWMFMPPCYPNVSFLSKRPMENGECSPDDMDTINSLITRVKGESK